MLSGAITAPFVFFNTLAFSAFEDDEEVKKRDGLFVSLTAASMSTAILLNAPLVLIYWEGWTLKDYTVSVAIMEVIVLAISFFEARRYKKEKLAGRRILKKASERKKKTAAANKI